MMSYVEFIDEYLEYLVFFLPFLTQLGVPLGLTFFILLFSSSIENSYTLIFFILNIAFFLLIGDLIAYFIGKRYGSTPLTYIGSKLNITPIITKTSKLVSKNSIYAILLTRTIFLGGAPITNYLLGIERFSLKKFIVINYLFEVLYVSIFAYIGFIFKDYWEVIFSLIEDGIIIIVIIISICLLIKYVLLKK
jgi:membrane protein DedA with SNARE-associated domain